MKACTVILTFVSVDQNRRYEHSNEVFVALLATGITLLQYFPE